MKLLLSTIFSICLFSAFAQDYDEVKVPSEVKEVNLFFKGAQIFRTPKATIPAGNHIVKFTKLSPFIDSKSVQVKAPAGITVLGVNFKKNFLNLEKPSKTMVRLVERIETIQDSIKLIETLTAVDNEKISFLRANQSIKGTENLQVSQLENLSTYYTKQMETLMVSKLERSKQIQQLRIREESLLDELKQISTEKKYPSGEVWVTVEAEKSVSGMFKLNYLVDNAGWFPNYDIRAMNITKPITLNYKASFYQDTKVNWKDIKLRFSSAQTNQNQTAPALKTYELSYYSSPPTYNRANMNNKIRGQVTDEYGEPLIGANILLQGSSIGTITDLDGTFELPMIPNGGLLEVSYIGYESLILPTSNTYMNIQLSEGAMLEEVVVIGYGRRSNPIARLFKGRSSNSKEKKEAAPMPVPKQEPEIQQIQKQTSVELALDKPYSLSSSKKNITLSLKSVDVPASFQYFSIPKIEEKVYLKAFVDDWEKLQLLEGEANLFFEGTFIGKTILDTRYSVDTLEIDLGLDKSVTIKREKAAELNKRTLIGTNQLASRHWKTTVKNNKNVPISITIEDQVPISLLKEIEVELIDKSNGSLDKATGKLEWQKNFEPESTNTLDLKYEIKYPKNRSLEIE